MLKRFFKCYLQCIIWKSYIFHWNNGPRMHREFLKAQNDGTASISGLPFGRSGRAPRRGTGMFWLVYLGYLSIAGIASTVAPGNGGRAPVGGAGALSCPSLSLTPSHSRVVSVGVGRTAGLRLPSASASLGNDRHCLVYWSEN